MVDAQNIRHAPVMALTTCKYCEHGNPPDANFCNACGATLTLAPCPHCGAVNEVASKACYQCHGSLQVSSNDELVPALPAVAIATPSPHRRTLAIAGTAAAVIVAFASYYAYRHFSADGPPPPATANTDAKGRSGPAQPASTAGPAATPVTANPVTPQLIERRAGSPPVARPDAAVIAAPVAAAGTASAGTAGRLDRPNLGPCTERVAALGLCTLQPVAKKEAPAAAVPAVAPPQTNTGGAPCTEAAAALGLCPTNSK